MLHLPHLNHHLFSLTVVDILRLSRPCGTCNFFVFLLFLFFFPFIFFFTSPPVCSPFCPRHSVSNPLFYPSKFLSFFLQTQPSASLLGTCFSSRCVDDAVQLSCAHPFPSPNIPLEPWTGLQAVTSNNNAERDDNYYNYNMIATCG